MRAGSYLYLPRFLLSKKIQVSPSRTTSTSDVILEPQDFAWPQSRTVVPGFPGRQGRPPQPFAGQAGLSAWAGAGAEDGAAESTSTLVRHHFGDLCCTWEQTALQRRNSKMQDPGNGRATLLALKRNKSANKGIGEKRTPGFVVSSSGGFPVLVVHHPITIRVWNEIFFILQDYL